MFFLHTSFYSFQEGDSWKSGHDFIRALVDGHTLFCACCPDIIINSTHFTFKSLDSNIYGQLIYKDFQNILLVL